jgi:hypothetical protein
VEEEERRRCPASEWIRKRGKKENGREKEKERKNRKKKRRKENTRKGNLDILPPQSNR